MKKYIIYYVFITLVLIIILLMSYIIISARTPIVGKLIKVDKDNVIYKARNISLYPYSYGMGEDLQYKENGNWVYVKRKGSDYVHPIGFGLRGLMVNYIEFNTNLNEYAELKNGEYRIEKEFYREEKGKNRITYSLYIYFDI